MIFRRADSGNVATTIAIILVSALLGTAAAWLLPGIDRYTRDWLMRSRGVLPPPEDIAIVAIDEASIARYGQFPWRRSVMAKAIRIIAKAQPRAIALDVLYTDPTSPDEDAALANAIAAVGNVVVAAQLNASPGNRSAWLMPLPQIASAAPSVGHVNVHAEAESVARDLPIRAADDDGRVLYAMPVEAIRVAERIAPGTIIDGHRSIIVGSYEITVHREKVPAVARDGTIEVLRAARMPIDYIGPPGSFAPVTYSMSDVLDGSAPLQRLAGKYVLIGATAASLGDRFAAPFTHHTDLQGNQHGSLMAGVEVLANALNTILRHRFYSELPEWLRYLWAVAVAALTVGLPGMAQGKYESVRQVLVFVGTGMGIMLVSWLSYKHLLIFPPVTEQFVAFASAGVLGLLRRSIATGARLDTAIGQMADATRQLVPVAPFQSAAEAVGRLTGAESVAILRSCGRDKYRVSGRWGDSAGVPDNRPVALHAARRLLHAENVLEYRLNSDLLLIGVPAGTQIPDHLTKAAVEVARAYLGSLTEPARNATVLSPAGVEARARFLAELNAHMIERWGFVELAMRSVQDGLLITGPDGQITFCNAAAAEALQARETALIGQNLLDRLSEIEPSLNAHEVLTRILADRTFVDREITTRGTRPRKYTLRLAPVTTKDGGVIGMVASLSDITRQQELQQTKNDVISLVSHEMRTPLTAIQGMSELLASFDMPRERRSELSTAINDEAKRLTRMITQYLDITRLESGATVLRPSAVRAEQLIRRTALLLEPIAAQREMRITYDFGSASTILFADADLLSRAIENLVSNAIKYGSPGTEIQISARTSGDDLLIEVQDHGAGIRPEDIHRIFEKFYRVPRAENADVPGTGLGLPLVREIAELHGGSISVQSTPGVGSVFTLRIPLYTDTGRKRDVKNCQI